MKNIIFFIIFIVFSTNHLFGQKMKIDSSVYDRWSSVEGGHMTNNGRFIYYGVKNGSGVVYSSVLIDSRGKWKMEISGQFDIHFTSDSKLALFMNKDTLMILRLGRDIVEKIPNVSSFLVSEVMQSGWIAYRLKASNDLMVRDVIKGKSRSYSFVKNYSFSKEANVLILEMGIDSKVQELKKVEMLTGEISDIWKGDGLVRYFYNAITDQLVFMVSNENQTGKSIWCKHADEPSILLVDSLPMARDSSFVLDELTGVSKNNRFVFFTVKKLKKEPTPKINSSGVIIWSYQDKRLKPAQFDEETSSVHSFVVSIADRLILEIAKEKERVLSTSDDEDVFLVECNPGGGDAFEDDWNISASRSYFIRSIKKTNDNKLELRGSRLLYLSPGGKFVIFYDTEKSTYFSYEIATGLYRNITSKINVSWIEYYRDDMSKNARGIAGWLRDDSDVLIYDRFDIWSIDPLGNKKPKNITNGYGLKNNIVFSTGLSETSHQIFGSRDTLLLNAINLANKENGYFHKKISVAGNPIKLTMGNYIYNLINNPYVDWNGNYPTKARDANRYLMLTVKQNSSPNYFVTDDFRNFKQISYNYPEQKYNWYFTELHTWKKEDGTELQGVLYKPENFDPNKKYPVIFYYYEKKSFSLNEYLMPENISGKCNINIPTYVSNGYLVFTPDINYAIGDPMQGTYDAIVSAAHYVSNLPYVDSEKIGIGGCSFGGIETNYLVTHTNLFAAAYSSSSLSDLVSAYGSISGTNQSLYSLFEAGSLRMGQTLWEIPDAYIKNSSIFSLHKVTTPLLLMHTTIDGICPFPQALEMYMGLRRLGKRVWLLEYPEGNHGIYGKSAIDFSVRLRQFFDHYLKGSAAPNWMLNDIPSSRRRRENGYELDTKGRTPGPGLLKPEEQVKVDSLMVRKPITVTLR